jgi:hypothetical protein
VVSKFVFCDGGAERNDCTGDVGAEDEGEVGPDEEAAVAPVSVMGENWKAG